jgi:ATP-dependent Clp protease ATP-binding subunit ClpC
MTTNLDRFTVRARAVLQRAQAETQPRNHPLVGTEHLLLALVEEPEAAAGHILATLGVDLAQIRAALEVFLSRGDVAVTGKLELGRPAQQGSLAK